MSSVQRGEPESRPGGAALEPPAGAPPDPRSARTVADLLHHLRLTRAWAGTPTYREIARRIDRQRAGRAGGAAAQMARSTVADYFGRSQRRRLDYDLLFDILRGLGVAAPQLDDWRRAWQTVFAPADPAEAVAVEFGLPAETPYFSGRDGEMDALLSTAGGVVVIEGMAGVGKTQLVTHVGRRLARSGAFSRQLYVNLRGFDPDRTPADPAEVLASFLRGLGLAANRVPMDLAGRAAKYRELLASHNPLVVLDNAADEKQVAPLLPGPACGLTLVTSRSPLRELAAAVHLPLDVFSGTESRRLLADILGDERVEAEPGATERIADLCGHLPLALALVAHQIAARPDWSLHDHAARLATLGIQGTVGRAFLGSYQGLPPRQRRAVALCALHPGHDLTEHSAAALIGADAPAVRRMLDDFVAHRLLQERADGRYEFHDLVRDCMTERLHDEVPDSGQQEALQRLLSHYQSTAAAAMDAYAPHERAGRAAVDGDGGEPAVFADAAAATAWLDAERANLVAAAAVAADRGWRAYPVDLSRTLQRYLDTGGHLHDAELLHTNAVRVADGADRAPALTGLASVYWRQGRYHDVIGLLRQALVVHRRDGDQAGQARCQVNLGIAYWRIGLYQQALEHEREGMALAAAVGDRRVEAIAHNNLGNNLWRLGRYDEAMAHQRTALELIREQGDRNGECRTLNNLGAIHLRQGDLEQAGVLLETALAQAREIGDWETESNGLTNLGIVHRRLGHHEDAMDLHRRALAITRETGNRDGEAAVLNDLGECLQHHDDAAAAESHGTALDIAVELGNRYEQARAHGGLARCAPGLQTRREHARAAIDEFKSLGTPEAEELAGLLD